MEAVWVAVVVGIFGTVNTVLAAMLLSWQKRQDAKLAIMVISQTKSEADIHRVEVATNSLVNQLVAAARAEGVAHERDRDKSGD